MKRQSNQDQQRYKGIAFLLFKRIHVILKVSLSAPKIISHTVVDRPSLTLETLVCGVASWTQNQGTT